MRLLLQAAESHSNETTLTPHVRCVKGTINNVLDLKILDAEAATGRVPRLQKREPVALREMFADVLDVCRVACSKDIVWANSDDALAYPHQLQARHFALAT
jgi:hypothetical protein